jgi:hypothetical protein
MTSLGFGPLFDQQPPYHRYGTDTERTAALSMLEKAKSLRERTYSIILMRREWGATRDEIDQLLEITPNVTQPRLRELEIAGRIKKTDRTRPTRSGRQATVYVEQMELVLGDDADVDEEF